MKKIITLSCMALLAFGTMMANWQPSDTESIRLDAEGTTGQAQMKTVRTPEGNIALTWLRPERKADGFGYRLHLQVFDANGNARFGDEGIVVADQITMSYTTDYALALADNGDILIAYHDVRNDPANQANAEVFVYRYTQQGVPVWDAEGVKLPTKKFAENPLEVSDIAPVMCVSGGNIYVAANHGEYYMAEANEDNWEPSPWFPNQEMPDSVLVNDTQWQLFCLNADGEAVNAEPVMMETTILMLMAAPEGDAYMVYDNEDKGVDAMRINGELANVWAESSIIEMESISSGFYMPSPIVVPDGKGGLIISYRKLLSWSGYQVMNHLQPNGEVLREPVSCNNTTDGNAGEAVLGVKENSVMVAWEYEYEAMTMYVNQLSFDGDFMWPGEIAYGQSLDENEMWGFKPVKVIPQTDGWVVLYGNVQSWNGANFMVVKIDDMGNIVWTKQILEENFKSNGLSVVYDEKNAYIFYTQEGNGMYVMCVDIAGQGGSSVDEVQVAPITKTELFTIDGKRVNEMENGAIYIVRSTDANGNVTTMKVKK